jgi:hypothetical protein
MIILYALVLTQILMAIGLVLVKHWLKRVYWKVDNLEFALKVNRSLISQVSTHLEKIDKKIN